MATQLANYLPAMQALNDFFEMLYDALQMAMPEAKFSNNGAFVWRGYRIDTYKNFPESQFYCMLYPGNPNELLFKEGFQYKGKYLYPFKRSIDLQSASFFGMSREEQLNALIDFVTSSSEAALQWIDSGDRAAEVPRERQQGKTPYRKEHGGVHTYNQIPEIYLEAFRLQERIFQQLIPIIFRVGEQTFGRRIDLLPNALWSDWHFRGYRMKIRKPNGERPSGRTPRVWRIYFHNPSVITYEMLEGKWYRVKNRFTLDEKFLSASESDRTEQLTQFVSQSLAYIDPAKRSP